MILTLASDYIAATFVASIHLLHHNHLQRDFPEVYQAISPCMPSFHLWHYDYMSSIIISIHEIIGAAICKNCYHFTEKGSNIMFGTV
jgi:hypothetical protein